MRGTDTVGRGDGGTTGTVAEGGFAVSYLRTSHPGGPLTERDRARPRQIRRIVRAQLRHWGLADLVESAQLVVTELVTNAFQHGWGDEVRIHLSHTAEAVKVEVRTGPMPVPRPRRVPAGRPVAGGCPGPRAAFPHPAPFAPDDRLAERGRGLILVEALAQEWGVHTDGGTVWCVLTVGHKPDGTL